MIWKTAKTIGAFAVAHALIKATGEKLAAERAAREARENLEAALTAAEELGRVVVDRLEKIAPYSDGGRDAISTIGRVEDAFRAQELSLGTLPKIRRTCLERIGGDGFSKPTPDLVEQLAEMLDAANDTIANSGRRDGQPESLTWILERAKWFSKDRCFLGASDAKHLLDIQNEANAIRMRDKASGVIASARFLAAYLIAWIEKIEARNVNEPTE